MGEADWRTVFSAGPGRAHLGLLRLSGSGKEIDLWGVTLCAAGRGCWRSPLLQMRQNGLDHIRIGDIRDHYRYPERAATNVVARRKAVQCLILAGSGDRLAPA